jgi:hypothetical protein
MKSSNNVQRRRKIGVTKKFGTQVSSKDMKPGGYVDFACICATLVLLQPNRSVKTAIDSMCSKTNVDVR